MAPLSFILSGDWTSPELVPGGRALLAFDCALVKKDPTGKATDGKGKLFHRVFSWSLESTSIEVSRETGLHQKVAGSFAADKPWNDVCRIPNKNRETSTTFSQHP